MPSFNPQRIASLTNSQELQAALRAQDKNNTDVAVALKSALVEGDTLRVYQPYTQASPLAVPSYTSYSTPVADYLNSAGQSIPNSTTTVLNYATKVLDTDNAVTTGAAWVFTVPTGRSGMYVIDASVTIDSAAAMSAYILSVKKNGSEYRRIGRTQNTAAGLYQLCGTATLSLVAGDTIALTVFQNTGGPQPTESNTLGTWVTISRLGGVGPPTVPSCFPFDLAWPFTYAPTVVLALCTDASTPSSPTNLAASLTDWVMLQRSSQLIRIRNIPGLLPSTSYAVTVIAF